MRPIVFEGANKVYVGHDETVQDLHVMVEDDKIVSVWELTDEERRRLVMGDNVALMVTGHAHPPVRLEVVQAPGVGEDDPEARRRLRELT